ncbi:MAG: glutamate-1-semialdehyde 2,1-aminomutase [Bacteroidetes bacterium]|nr:glutamate-1-semialdehyde 2,1-aminomutase [Bacteroidota bacterium]MCH8525317.1 glutamate-1-semialdehyde 2,1-aminomutase [Balneolales bacterium]
MQITESKKLFEKAVEMIPGGVNSPVRAFKAVGGTPIFFKKASGAYLYDEDDNRYIDYIGSWGPMLLGHAYPKVIEAVQQAAADSTSFGAPTRREVELAELILDMVPTLDKIRMVNSGTEACMSAIRVARGYTGRHKILKFEGNYHGHADSFLIKAGSGAMTFGTPSSPGVTPGTAADTLTARHNDLEQVRQICLEHGKELAAIIIEPVAGNMGCIPPEPGFLEGLRALCDEHGIVLIFDEVMTGFRLARGGAQELLEIEADLVTYGKIIGAGLPVGAYAGKAEIMNCVSPTGPVYQAGTLSGNPLAMAAGYALLSELHANPSIYNELDQKSAYLEKGLREVLERIGEQYTINRLGSMINIFFGSHKVQDFDTALKTDVERFKDYFHGMLHNGVYLPPAAFESWFLSNALTYADLDATIEATEQALSPSR